MLSFFDELTEEDIAQAGGKCKTLAVLRRAGYPVPDGFVIMPPAFASAEITPALWEKVVEAADRLRGRDRMAFAVRSSSLIEDDRRTSSAGQYRAVLNVDTLEGLREAVQAVLQSGIQAQAQAYAQTTSSVEAPRIAVIVQRMIQPVLSGVAFTVDPVAGSYARMVGRVVQGNLEALLAGRVDGSPFHFYRPEGEYNGPAELKVFSEKLYDILESLELDLGSPQDVKWAITDGQVYVLQSRPIKSLCGSNPLTGEWNDTRTGDFLWMNGNLGEAVPGVMTPYTWSLVRQFYEQERKLNVLGQMRPTVGNIFGRLYANVSLWASGYAAVGQDPRKALEASAILYGRIPEGIDIPVIPVARWRYLLSLVAVFQAKRELRKVAQELPEFVESVPSQVREVRARIQAIKTPRDLASYWQAAVEPLLLKASRSILACFYAQENTDGRAIREVGQMAGDEQAASLLAGWSTLEEYFMNLGPLLGLLKVKRGDMSPRAYYELYGHRGSDEFEFSKPSPVEDPDWIRHQLTGLAGEVARIEALLAAQHSLRQEALNRFRRQHPEQAAALEACLEQVVRAVSLREMTRNEATRVIRLARDFALQAAELTGLGEDIFYLYIDEVLELLNGSDSSVQFIPARRETDRHYRALPTLPAVIRGRFDAFAWEKDPDRRSDLFDASASSQAASPHPARKKRIVGFPASAGVVEGSVRQLTSLEGASQLKSGEILVTSKLDIGWTLVFPKCGGIVTDTGMPLSHAAIVARELGIPAVMGTGDATHLLQTGMRVRLDGLRGTVEILGTG